MQRVSQGPNWTENADKADETDSAQHAYYQRHAHVMSEMPDDLAEREGFEPPIELPLCLISSQVHSTGLCHLSALDRTHLEGKRWGPAAGDPWREAAAIADSCDRTSRAGRLPSSKLAAAMRLRILSLPVSMPRWQFRTRRHSIPRGTGVAGRSLFPGSRQPKRERRLPGALRKIGLHGRKQPSVMAKCYFTLWPRLTRQRGSKSHGKNSLREFKWHVLHGVCRELKFR